MNPWVSAFGVLCNLIACASYASTGGWMFATFYAFWCAVWGWSLAVNQNTRRLMRETEEIRRETAALRRANEARTLAYLSTTNGRAPRLDS